MFILTRIKRWRHKRRAEKMLMHTVIVLNAFNTALRSKSVNRSMRHRFMRAVSKNPRELLSLFHELCK